MRPGRAADDGFIMVAMLISIAVGAIWMSAALPSWRQQAIREKEAELIFRGEQYARAIYLYRMKNNGANPQSIDQLVQQRYLRKKYLDPITGKDFVPLGGLNTTTPFQPPQQQGGRQGGPAPFTAAGITGVRSSSQDESIKIYNNATVYSQWAFDWPYAAAKAGAAPTPEGGRRGGPAGERGRGGIERGGGGGRIGGERGGAGRGGGRIGGERGGQIIDEVQPIRGGRGGRGF